MLVCSSSKGASLAIRLAIGIVSAAVPIVAAGSARVAIKIVERGTDRPMPARIHLEDAAGQAHQPRQLPFWRDHFVCGGEAELDLPAGEYSIEAERGPEFSAHKATFTVSESSGSTLRIELERLVDLAADGWWSGDLHVHRAPDDAEMLMAAEDLHVAPFITWWNKENRWRTGLPDNPLRKFNGKRFCHVLAGEDERHGGALLYFNLKQPLDITAATQQFPCSLVYAAEARKQPGAWIDIEKPFWWDFPLWLSSGLCDSVGIANNHMLRDGMLDSEAWGKPRNLEQFPSPRGNGFWTQENYYHALECGLRLPPSAGSASGVLPNPVGYNRVYVQAGRELDYEKWFDALRSGRAFVSNGPLLRCRANGKLPGEVFTAAEGATLEVAVDAILDGRSPVPALEIVRDGKVARSIPTGANGQRVDLGRLDFTSSGWFLVRAISSEPKTFRFASSAPFYVEIGAKKRRISKAAAQFFLDWVKEGMNRVPARDPEQREAVLDFHRTAEEFWRSKLGAANAD
jgi:hypothetical protein